MKRGLEKHDFVVDAFSDPKQALEQFSSGQYLQIIADIRMPKMNGFEFAREIWAKDPNANICFLTSFEIFEDEAKKIFSHLNSHCFITKPITAKDLAQHIRNHA